MRLSSATLATLRSLAELRLQSLRHEEEELVAFLNNGAAPSKDEPATSGARHVYSRTAAQRRAQSRRMVAIWAARRKAKRSAATAR